MAIRLSEKLASLSNEAQELFIMYGIAVVLIFFSRRTISIVWPNETTVDTLEDLAKEIRKLEQELEEKKMELTFNQFIKGKVNLNEFDATKTKSLLEMFSLIRAKLDERKRQLQQQSLKTPPFLSNSESTTETDVDMSDNFHAVGTSTSLEGGSDGDDK
ncbi:uncharacterized protein [Solanum tuberosum]|uniref:uncharacterized protein n=1 Tax=Solanum tuberosum TaxID=4113 RepID=UPI000739F894|nr:PREDICTED: uncharacterized protein LOC107060247 [Solanum tuberosum]KAH0673129.1 hypothetical protein KY284_024216 [Solanum tuberosum]